MMKNILLLCLFTILLISCKKDEKDGDPFPDSFSETILKDHFVTAIAFDKTGTAWLGTLNQGLIKYDGRSTVVYDSTNSILTKAAIWDIKIDKKGNIWIGSDDLIRYDGIQFTRFNARNFGLPRNFVPAIAIDSKDNVWFSCSSFRSGGLVKYDGNKFTTFTPENSKMPGNMIASLAIDRQDRLWIAVNDAVDATALVKIENDQLEAFGSKEIGVKSYYYGNIVTNKQSELVASISYTLSSTMVTGRPQIFKFDGKKASILNLPNENAVIYHTNKVFVDSRDYVWASFSGEQDYGVLKDGEWNLKSLDTEGIFAFGESPSGEIWLGTGKGVFILKQ
jgi:ligand-binding sensor domain-containing protein